MKTYTLKSISVIVPTYNEPLIAQTVKSITDDLMRHTDVAFEILVIGKDESGLLDTTLPHLPLIETSEHQKGAGPAAARNLGIQEARYDWIFFIDADCLVLPGWSQALIERFEAGESVVAGSVTLSAPYDYWPLAYNVSMYHEFLPDKPAEIKKYLPTINLAIKRKVIEQVGLMNETLARVQDYDWTIRMALAGYRLFFEPKAAIAHYPNRYTFKPVWRDWRRSGYYSRVNRLRYADYYQSPKLLNHKWFVRLLSPLVAAYVTAGIFLRTPQLWRYTHTVPAVYLTKIAWCIGASS